MSRDTKERRHGAVMSGQCQCPGSAVLSSNPGTGCPTFRVE